MAVFDPRVFDPRVFDTGGTVAPVDRTINVSGRMPPMRGPVRVVQAQRVAVAGRMPGLSGRVGVVYVSNTARPLVALVRAREQVATPAPSGTSVRWVDATASAKGHADRYRNALPRPRGWSFAWHDALTAQIARVGRYQDALPLPVREAVFSYQDGLPLRLARVGRYQEALSRNGTGVDIAFQQGRAVWRAVDDLGFQEALPLGSGFDAAFQNGIPSAFGLSSRYQDGTSVLAGASEHPVHPPGPVDPTDPETIVIPVRKIYTVINTAELRRVDDDTEIPCGAMTLSLDVDSWTWGFTASVPGDYLAIVEPVDGEPVEVEATVNGVAYRAIIESISRDRVFGRADLRIAGRGRSALLDAPYAPFLTFGSAFDRTVQQLANEVLSINGVPLGWDLDTGWTPDDWIVPAGVWNFQGTYIAALNAIAASAGAYVQPHRTDKALSVLRRYPAKPWEWNDVIPDYELPADIVQRESIAWADKPAYNRVYVRGVKAAAFGQVNRAGTAGDFEAPMIVDSLMTDPIGLAQRALPVLADTGRQAAVSLRLPVLAETGIIPPGKFVRYVDGGITRIGLTRSVSAEVQRTDKKLTVWQTIGVETHDNV